MHGMTSYFVRRLLLVPVTFVCITFMVYTIVRLAPGGPIEQARQQMRAAAMTEGGGGGSAGLGVEELELPPEAIEQLKVYYKLDRAIPVGYLIWLGLYPDRGEVDTTFMRREVARIDWDDEAGEGMAGTVRLKEGGRRRGKVFESEDQVVVRTHKGFSGILGGDFGKSYRYSDPVLSTITSKFPISIYFGLIGYLASWLVCIPLGVYKAIRHRSVFDTTSSLVVFLGYSIPGFVAALSLMLVFATDNFGMNILPLGDFRSENWDQMWEAGNTWWCIKDQIRHTIIPIIGYVLASFATMTILMKNSLLDNLGADYVRTAFAKGLSERRVIFVHALRNSLIPICVGVGHAIGLLFAGSFLIEKTCNIPGMGLLGFNSLVERDYPVLMGILTFGVLIRLTGNIISDVILALVDPRVRFG